jgi:hypothetical protein
VSTMVLANILGKSTNGSARSPLIRVGTCCTLQEVPGSAGGHDETASSSQC